ncbi:SpoIIE family protein phosphatase [Streptomyces sp. 15-116A]|uniref:SpoIIE family protein phosphatase n=1 Tax=Streptomyces sp. 15-116A TaxID=2259035 RepID=UPI0021B497EB|nr:SpoIIE family protein phosphatase [Streptomyces sp. 15-116A]MCT7356619.1 SpoIIE family protein phosphatase [Streptomyces sp. 15-116A]
MSVDHTENWSARERLRSEPGTLLEHVSVAVIGIDDSDRICLWGPGAQELFGHGDGALAQHVGLLFPARGPGAGADEADAGPYPADAGPYSADAGPYLADRGRTLGYWRGRLPVRHRDGTVFDCGFRAFTVVSGEDRTVVMALASRSTELDRVKTNLAFLDALFDTCPIGLVMLDQDLRYLHLNQALADMDGLTVEEHIGRRMPDLMAARDTPGLERLLRGVAEEGRPVVGHLLGVRRPEGDQVRSVSLFPLSQAVGTRPGVGGLVVDVTDREAALVEAAESRERLELLDRATARIGTTLDVKVTAGELVDAAVPDFADASVVEVVDWMDEPEIFDPRLPLVTHRIASGTILPPPADELVSGLETVHYPPGSSIHRMLRTGRPIAVAVDTDFVTTTVMHQERARILIDSGLTGILIAPLIARGTVQGLTMFGRAADRPPFTEQDLRLAAELSSRAALCLDNARLYTRVQDIALTLQRALLPTNLATSPHVEVAHRYVPGSHVTLVGGDWYDAISLPGGRVALVVGDVMGHGVPAAAAMGRLRITAKALARRGPEPSELLTELDACAQESGIELATCLYIDYDPGTGRARIARAGHPPPLVRSPDGRVETAGDLPGVPLGVGGHPFHTTEIALSDGAVLALYTDGLVESRGRGIDEGVAAAGAVLSRATDGLEETADRMLSHLLGGPPGDDTVLVLARVRHRPRTGLGAH